jgi:hypothetical protein
MSHCCYQQPSPDGFKLKAPHDAGGGGGGGGGGDSAESFLHRAILMIRLLVTAATIVAPHSAYKFSQANLSAA